jgi:cytochrome oxidase Cu insertion factor (SCO1/SenC/PrrC family)
MSRGAFALCLALALSCGTVAAAAVPRDARDVPLVDQTGTTFTLRDVRKPAALIFIATRCHDACPVAEGLFAKLSAELARAHVDARLLTVTLEPDADPPIAMANLARAFSADPHRWRWASGRPADVRAVLDAFNVTRLDGKFHGAFCYVLGRDGRPRRLVLLSTSADRELLGLLARG